MGRWHPALVLALLAPFAAAADLAPSEVFRVASPSIVVVEALDQAGAPIAQGSGVVIARGVVVSNCHVFSQAVTAVVRYQKQRYTAVLRHGDSDRDLCSFSVEGLPAPAAVLGTTTTLSVGDRAYAIGAPQGLELTLSDGLLSAFRGDGSIRLLQTTVPISPGSSGGGLFDSSGRLVGITTMYLDEGQQLNFAVPVEWIKELPIRHEGATAARTAAYASMSEPEQRARQELNELGYQLEALDAAAYARREAELREEVIRITATLPPDQWVAAARRFYRSLIQRDQARAVAQAAQIETVSLGSAVNEWNEIVGEQQIFLPADAIHAAVAYSNAPSNAAISALWTYGSGEDKQIVYEEVAYARTGSGQIAFSISKPDGWPSGGYQLEVTIGDATKMVSFCVENLQLKCRLVRGVVYSYVKDAKRHYTSKPPPANALDTRSIPYSFYEVTHRP